MALRLFLILASLTPLYSLSVDIAPGKKECFLISATIGMPCYGSFEILSPNPEPLTITVKGPAPKYTVYSESKYSGEGALSPDATEGSFSFNADIDGDYSLCIANGDENQNDGISRLVAFNFRSLKRGEGDYELVGIESELVELLQGLNFLKDHQNFMNQREHAHASSLESINLKVQVWTIIEAIILIIMSLWQVSYISRFFETKRRM